MRNRLCFRKSFLPAHLIFSLVLILAIPQTRGAESENAIYDADPKHLWNRLNETLFVRVSQDGKKFGLDELDILYWSRTKNLLVDPSHQKALTILDEFVDTHGEKLIRDPLKRVLLQRDLWELFDWSATPFGKINESEARRKLQSRLALMIRRVALSTNEIALLPDNYAKGEREKSPDMPQKLFQTNGNWINVGINSHNEPVALAHARNFSGRSTFLVMLRHPDGRQAGLDYLKLLRSFKPLWVDKRNINFPNEQEQNPDLPQFPKNTQWALVRRMNVIDTDGQIQPTRLVESIQMRTYLEVSRLSANPEQAQRFQEFQMSRKSVGALHEIEQGEKAFRQFFSKGFDPFEQLEHQPSEFQMEPLKSCAECHHGSGIYSVNTYSRRFSGVSSIYTTQIIDSNPNHESQVTIDWMRQQFNWGLLQGLWSTNPK